MLVRRLILLVLVPLILLVLVPLILFVALATCLGPGETDDQSLAVSSVGDPFAEAPVIETTTSTVPPTTAAPPRTTAPRAARKAPAAPRPAQGPPIALDGADPFTVLADCESGDGKVGPPYSANPSARGRFFGAFQFMVSTWQGLGYSGNPADHPYSTQLEAAQKLVARSGWGQFPSCSRRMRAAGYI